MNYDYEEQVRRVYRTSTVHREVDAYAEPKQPVYNRDTYTYQQEPNLYQMNDQEHKTLKLYEEQLVANKHRAKTAEVTISKHVETEAAKITVPVEKERVIVERIIPAQAGRPVSPNEAAFSSQEALQINVYEEIPEIQKQAVVREEVRVRKVVEQDTVEATEKVR